jgi:hypothetical protein
MFVLIIGKLLADIMNWGLWGYGSIDYALLMPQKVRQFQPLWVVAVIKISTIWVIASPTITAIFTLITSAEMKVSLQNNGILISN